MGGQSFFQLTTPLMLVLFATGFALIWYHRRAMRSALLMALSYGVGAFALMVDFFRDSLVFGFSVFATNIPYYACIMLFVGGIAARYERRYPTYFASAVTAAVMAGLAWFTFVQPDLLIRTHIGNIGVGFLLARAALILQGHRRNPVDTIILGLLIVSAIQFMSRTAIVDYFWNATTTAESYSASPFALWLHLSVAFASLSLAAALFVGMGMSLISKAEKRAETDGLTGLLNRRAFEERAARAIAENSRAGLPVTLVVGDIDHFKRINDTYGHAVGDVAIRRFASVIKDASRKSDIAGRYGGEEFCLLLPTANTELGSLLAQSIRTQFASEAFDEMDAAERLTASLGVAQMRHGEDYGKLFIRADRALYRAKENGRDRVEIGDERARLREVAA